MGKYSGERSGGKMEIDVIGQMDGRYESVNRVYGKEGLCPTIPTSCGGGHMPKIVDCVAMRGRGEKNEQQLEIRDDDCTNSITTVQKDNMVLVRQATKEGVIPCEVGGGGRPKLSRQQNPQRKGARQWTDMPDSDNGEYP